MAFRKLFVLLSDELSGNSPVNFFDLPNETQCKTQTVSFPKIPIVQVVSSVLVNHPLIQTRTIDFKLKLAGWSSITPEKLCIARNRVLSRL